MTDRQRKSLRGIYFVVAMMWVLAGLSALLGDFRSAVIPVVGAAFMTFMIGMMRWTIYDFDRSRRDDRPQR